MAIKRGSLGPYSNLATSMTEMHGGLVHWIKVFGTINTWRGGPREYSVTFNPEVSFM